MIRNLHARRVALILGSAGDLARWQRRLAVANFSARFATFG